jgi:hypothetical protein
LFCAAVVGNAIQRKFHCSLIVKKYSPVTLNSVFTTTMKIRTKSVLVLVAILVAASCALSAQVVTYLPYIQPGDSGPFETSDQVVVAWQTNEPSAQPGAYSVSVANNPEYQQAMEFSVTGRVVDNYLSADPAVFGGLSIPTAYGSHVNYYAVLTGLQFGREYYYQVSGPGMPAGRFTASFHTRTRKGHFSFQVQGDEGYYPGIPNQPSPGRQLRGANHPYDVRCRQAFLSRRATITASRFRVEYGG